MKRILNILFLVVLLLMIMKGTALAQTYSFSLPTEEVHVYWNEDGSASLDYTLVFQNDPSASWIDFVDLGLPNTNFDPNQITADLDGVPITNISRGDYQGSGVGVALGLPSSGIRSGSSGTVHVTVPNIQGMLRTEDTSPDYASADFSPTWFDSSFVHGNTDLTVTFHLPPGVQPDEPRWHGAPAGFPESPVTGLDDQGRITYTWHNPSASGSKQYLFGASFPGKYVPADTISRPTLSERTGISFSSCLPTLICGGIIAFFGFVVVSSFYNEKRRKLQYLPPKISIEGHGIKRGLTAIEAAILLEQPMDKILTMILFSVIKKNAGKVIKRDPLEVEAVTPPPEDLNPYETKFLDSFTEKDPKIRRRLLQETMVDLVQSLAQKMKGFSRKETIEYYKSIVDRAWNQVEAADTPEVKSQKYNEVMEWTMLDKDYEGRTREIFRTGPVIIPTWWGRYDPSYGGGVGTAPQPVSTAGPAGGGSISLPHLPGSDFAASMVNSVQNFSSSVIGNVSEFTGGVTAKTNPAPVATTSRYGGGRSSGGGSSCVCACACACAGCACACAGGGR